MEEVADESAIFQRLHVLLVQWHPARAQPTPPHCTLVVLLTAPPFSARPKTLSSPHRHSPGSSQDTSQSAPRTAHCSWGGAREGWNWGGGVPHEGAVGTRARRGPPGAARPAAASRCTRSRSGTAARTAARACTRSPPPRGAPAVRGRRSGTRVVPLRRRWGEIHIHRGVTVCPAHAPQPGM